MDREILFRGKTKDGRWMYGYLLKTEKVHNKNKKDGYFIITGAHHNGGWLMIHGRYPVIPETVGQFTGLCDKNGVKIFEGDVVHCEAHLDQADMVVIFKVGQFRLVLCEKFKSYTTGFGYYDINCFNKTVIGNIHDNQGLKEEIKWLS